MLFDLTHYTIRRKVLKVFGASFHIFDGEGAVVGFSNQKAFKLREDIRIYADESMAEELLTIKARQIIDFSAAYDVVDAREGRKVGAARRKGFSSMMRDSWELLDERDRPLAQLVEDSLTMAMIRRFLSNLVPQTFHLKGTTGRSEAVFRQRFNPFIYKLDVEISSRSEVDRRLVLAAAVLIAAIEGRQK